MSFRIQFISFSVLWLFLYVGIILSPPAVAIADSQNPAGAKWLSGSAETWSAGMSENSFGQQLNLAGAFDTSLDVENENGNIAYLGLLDPLFAAATPTATETPTASPTATATPTASSTETATQTSTPTDTLAPTATKTSTLKPTSLPTWTSPPVPTYTSTPSFTVTAASPTTPPTPTASLTPTDTLAPTGTPTLSPTSTNTPTSMSTLTLTPSPTGTLPTPWLPRGYDLNKNHTVDEPDLLILIGYIHSNNPGGDFNRDGFTDYIDLMMFSDYWRWNY